MSANSYTPNTQDYSLINSVVDKKVEEHLLMDSPSGFYFLIMDLLLSLSEDEIKDSITDSNFLNISGETTGHDRGIDAVYIDGNKDNPNTRIHLFSCKYAMTFKVSRDKNIPSKDIDSILNLIHSIMQEDENLIEEVNPFLFSKVEEIWEIQKGVNPSFVLHICTNYAKGFEKKEQERLERGIRNYGKFSVNYMLMPDIVRRLTTAGKEPVNAKISALGLDYFEKSDGDVRALIANFDARDLIRIAINDEEARLKPDMDEDEYGSLQYMSILEDAFEDNVRLHLKKSSINRNIKSTALSEENNKFFYYNNGITITCKSFSFPGKKRSPVIEIEQLQIVNGAQTIYSLYEAFKESPEKIADIEILCRICETKNDDILSTRIAEFTNSQNPVQSRDIRSVDYIQQKLEIEFRTKGFFYERKRNQHKDKPKNKRLDAEKIGQVLMAFYNKSPYEAKNRKGEIFGGKYDEVFNDSINADAVLLAYEIYDRIEEKKSQSRSEITQDIGRYEEKSYIIYSSYYVLYIVGELARVSSIELDYKNVDSIWALYPKAILLIEKSIQQEKSIKGKQYSHANFFRSNKSKKYLEGLDEAEIDRILKE